MWKIDYRMISIPCLNVNATEMIISPIMNPLRKDYTYIHLFILFIHKPGIFHEFNGKKRLFLYFQNFYQSSNFALQFHFFFLICSAQWPASKIKLYGLTT